MSAREEILARVRAALAPGGAPAVDVDVEVEVEVEVAREYLACSDAGVATFVERLHHYEATTQRVGSDELDETVRATLRQRGVRRLVAPAGIPEGWLSETEPLRDSPPLEPQALDDADGVITTCALAIADTGTIVLDGGPGMGRRALSLVPDYHLCVVRAEQVVGSVPEAIAKLDPGRALTFISGPSATVDIEMVRVGGVHGPRTLEVVVAG